ncbi:MAG: HAD-IIIC family phosphatase [Pseudomonadota bacterium]|nr:HAD-IIIC family phosphatase [Pseudomonadota bacterium]
MNEASQQIRAKRDALISALVSGRPGGRVNRFNEPDEVFKMRIGESIDLLAGLLEGRPHYDSLYLGQRLFELHRADCDRSANLSASRSSVLHDKEILKSHISADFESIYDEATTPLCADAPTHVRTLFIGDCLMVEVMSFLVGPLLSEGVSIDAFPISPRSATQLHNFLSERKTTDYDVVFISPFSHAPLPEIEALTNPRRAWRNHREVTGLTDSIIKQVGPLLELLVNRFECPIFIHNASLTPRSTNLAKAVAASVALSRPLTRARKSINGWLSKFVAQKNEATFPHIHLIDEASIAHALKLRAGRLLYNSPFQHATALSQALAAEYQARIWTIASLLGRKLVVCDLDNTLWNGVIGEGPVVHYSERQASLLRLKKDCGIVLSIASKNDPANVHFQGGTLSMEDFVAPQISWGAKAVAISTIAQKLNLQTRHMVFLDDRPDERALVAEMHPKMLVLDPCEPETWKRIDAWAALTEGSSDLDRTTLYKQQLTRDALVATPDDAVAVRDASALVELKLVFTLGSAKKSELKRIAELINRTNQWNMCGTRTTFEQLRQWHTSADAVVMVGSAGDKFGEMGIVCVAVLVVTGDKASIPVFVLSCRVFGYGMETAMLRELQRRAESLGANTLVGKFTATAQNNAGRGMYATHGFVPDGEHFVRACNDPIPELDWATTVVTDI